MEAARPVHLNDRLADAVALRHCNNLYAGITSFSSQLRLVTDVQPWIPVDCAQCQTFVINCWMCTYLRIHAYSGRELWLLSACHSFVQVEQPSLIGTFGICKYSCRNPQEVTFAHVNEALAVSNLCTARITSSGYKMCAQAGHSL